MSNIKLHAYLLILSLSWVFLPDQRFEVRANDIVLVLNSNRKLEKYAGAERGFKSILKENSIEIDLRGKWIDELIIEETILDERPAIIYCVGLRAYHLAYKLGGRENKIIFSSIVNWRRLQTRDQICGIANEIAPAMQMMNFSNLFPEIKRFGILYSKSYSGTWLNQAISCAKSMDRVIVNQEISRSTKTDLYLPKLLSEIDVLWLVPDPLVLSSKKAVQTIFSQCEIAKIPIFAYDPAYLSYGAALVVSPDIETAGRQAGLLAKDLLTGRKLSEKILNVAGSEIILNLKSLEKLGLTFNPDALDSVNQIIE